MIVIGIHLGKMLNKLMRIPVSIWILFYLAASKLAEANEQHRIDCTPLANTNEELCKARGCIWSPVEDDNKGETASIRTPWCYFPDNYEGYQMIGEASGHNGHYKFMRQQASGLPDDIQLVGLQFEEVSQDVLRIRIYDESKVRYEPNIPKLNKPNNDNERTLERLYEYEMTAMGQLTVRRKSTGAIIFDTDIRKMIFSNQFIQLNSKLNSPNVYGLGEHYDTFLKKSDRWRPYSFFNTDSRPNPGGTRSYGVFPFYVNLDSQMKHAHGVYLRNSNPMDIIIQADQSITFRPIGGILDFIIFAGPTPNDVITQYQHLVGLPDLPPRWALGFHLCRYGYNSLDKTEEVWRRTIDAGIPFDVQWNDIDYMKRHNDFTYDTVHFKGLPEFVDKLHDLGMKYVLILDPGVSQEENYLPYFLGMEMDVFIKSTDGKVLVGKCWNDSNRTVFPDFSNPKSIEYWQVLFERFHQTIPFDGAWIDMNDISSFVDGSLTGCPNNASSIDRPPYEPGFYPLITNTLCLSAQHRDGLEYDVHNLYSFYEAIATYKALQAARPNTRPFIISRSSSPGQGAYGGHWNGDVPSQWSYLKWSIPSIIEHSMYGFSMMGSDICGFVGDTNQELCARWHTLGSFYTFTRNHNDEKSIEQDPVALGPLVVKAARDSLMKRYSLLPYLYNLVHRAHRYGEPIVRGAPFEFFPDPEALHVEDQFLWGQALLISPIVEQNTYEKSTYLTAGRWYETNVDLDNRPKRIDATKGYWHKTTNVTLTDIPLFYRGGHIIPIYKEPNMTTAKTVEQPLSLLVALCEKSMAYGEVYLDQGDNVDEKYDHAVFEAANNTLTIVMDRDDINPSMDFHQVTVLGLDRPVKSVNVNHWFIDYTYSEGELKFNLDSLSLNKSRSIVAQWTV